jgi:hypothetical protein
MHASTSRAEHYLSRGGRGALRLRPDYPLRLIFASRCGDKSDGGFELYSNLSLDEPLAPKCARGPSYGTTLRSRRILIA